MDSEKVIKKLDELRLLRGSLRRRLESQNPVGLYGYKNKNIGIIEITKEFSVEQIAKSAVYSYMYAYSILNNKPFKLGEPAIAKDAQYSYYYASYVLDKPFELGEPAIAKDAYYSYLYAYNILHKEFQLGEPAIARYAYSSYLYAHDVLHLSESEAKDWGKNYGQ